MLFLALQDEEVSEITQLIRKLKKDIHKAGIRDFILPMEESV
jgi:hypothetical protein